MPDDEAAIGSETSTVEVMGICRRRINDFRGLSREDREDAVQQAVARVLEAIARETVTDVAAFARRVAYHCAVDVWRRNKAEAAKRLANGSTARKDVEDAPDSSPTPDQLADEKRRLATLPEVAGDVRQWVARAPHNYRHVLEQHYLQGRSFDSLAEEELARRVAAGEVPASQAHDPVQRKRARNAVHAWHTRALRWLQQRAPTTWRKVIP